MILAQKQTHRSMGQNIESPEVNPCIYGHLIYDKRRKKYTAERTGSSTNDTGKTGPPHAKE